MPYVHNMQLRSGKALTSILLRLAATLRLEQHRCSVPAAFLSAQCIDLSIRANLDAIINMVYLPLGQRLATLERDHRAWRR